MSVTIKKVESKKDLKTFVKFPLELYKGCPYYVPNIYIDEMSTLDPSKNPMSKYAKTALFLAYKDGKVAARRRHHQRDCQPGLEPPGSTLWLDGLH